MRWLARLGVTVSGYDWGIQRCRSYRWEIFSRFTVELHRLTFCGEKTLTIVFRRKK
jgi:hypothetical protein